MCYYITLLLPFVQIQMQIQIQIQIQIQVSVAVAEGGGSMMMRMMTSSIHPAIHPSLAKIHCYAFITVYVMAQMFKYQKMHESYSKSMTFLPQRSLED
jgi:hypothetical protein